MIDCNAFRNAMTLGMPEVLRCDPVQNGQELRLRTIYEHADGDLIDMFVVDDAGGTWITDHGEAFRHLDVIGFDPTNTAKKKSLLQEALGNLAVQNIEGRLMVPVNANDPKDLATKIIRLGQAMTRVGDMLFLSREMTQRFFREDVRDFLRDNKIEMEESAEVVGRSGQQYTVDFKVRRRTSALLIKTLSTGSRAAAETVVNGAVRMFLDISRSELDDARVSLIDDSADVWTPPQFSILQSVGETVLWSSPQQLIELAA
jgi:hypothetical protein